MKADLKETIRNECVKLCYQLIEEDGDEKKKQIMQEKTLEQRVAHLEALLEERQQNIIEPELTAVGRAFAYQCAHGCK